jgi:hypothetical protein
MGSFWRVHPAFGCFFCSAFEADVQVQAPIKHDFATTERASPERRPHRLDGLRHVIGTDGPLHLGRKFDPAQVVNTRERRRKYMTKVTDKSESG